ncbi:MAG: hypothetical protein AAGF10_02460 [Verrucomicrobiota bacterium]
MKALLTSLTLLAFSVCLWADPLPSHVNEDNQLVVKTRPAITIPLHQEDAYWEGGERMAAEGIDIQPYTARGTDSSYGFSVFVVDMSFEDPEDKKLAIQGLTTGFATGLGNFKLVQRTDGQAFGDKAHFASYREVGTETEALFIIVDRSDNYIVLGTVGSPEEIAAFKQLMSGS